MNEATACPCGSGRTYDSCCGPLLAGSVRAASPEDLMRSRYTAYVKQDLSYLAKTLHPSQRSDYDEQGAARWARKADWEALDIVKAATDPADAGRGRVEFRAHYRMDGAGHVHHELAEFRKSAGVWYFYDGKMVGAGQFRREAPKVGRNDPCPCGSGRKYKKCCGV
jgi:SEC-C motif-containing protein